MCIFGEIDYHVRGSNWPNQVAVLCKKMHIFSALGVIQSICVENISLFVKLILFSDG